MFCIVTTRNHHVKKTFSKNINNFFNNVCFALNGSIQNA